jgi:hypothetical protein
MYVRLSRAYFELERYEEIRRLLVDGEKDLAPGIRKLAGLVKYHVGIDRSSGTMINVSVWDAREHAEQMDSFQPMIDSGKHFRKIGVRFDPIVNYEVLWEI